MQLLVPLLKQFEGLHKINLDGLVHPYICPAGYWTQGWGLLVKDGSATPITKAEADERLLDHLPGYIKATYDLCPRLWLEPEPVAAAIQDFTFNLGSGRLRASTLRKRVNEGDWAQVQIELSKWVYGGGRRLPGLILRRKAESDLIRSVYG